MMYKYNVFGVNINSEIPLPELSIGAGPCNVEIKVDRQSLTDQEELHDSAWVHIGRDEAVLFVRDVGWFEIREGREVIVKPYLDSRMSLLRMYLLGPVMAILLYQCCLLVLHASSILVNGKTIAFLAESGWGKSSLAAALHHQGHQVLSDDLTPVEYIQSAPFIYPGPPHLKVSVEVSKVLNLDWDSFAILDPQESKRVMPMEITQFNRPRPLNRIYILTEDAGPEIVPLRPQEAVIELVRHTYPTRLSQPGDSLHLKQCGQLARTVKMFRLMRSPSLSLLSELAAFVESDLASCKGRRDEESD